MASVEKFSFAAVNNQIRHIERTIKNNSNKDIDIEKSSNNYSLIDRDISAYSYFRQRLADPDLYVYKNKEIKPLCGWIVTAPDDVPEEKEDLFFRMVFEFLNDRYGAQNCVQACVHKDESGRAHLHYLFMPVAERKKMSANHKEKYKICANDVINRRELRDFHPALGKYLSDHGLPCSVYTGITAKNGGNRSVKELKQERELARERTQERQHVITW